MIEFKKNVKKALPYDREEYLEFLDDDFDSSVEWNGVSFQLNSGKENGLPEFVEIFECLFKNVVSKLDDGSLWIVNHDDKDLNWFPNDCDNLINLRNLFKQKNVPNTYRGALLFTKDDLLEFYQDLISYPIALFYNDSLLYKNIDISHGKLQFIIKISGHLTIDLLSTNKELLRKIVDENSTKYFNVKEYRGTSLWT